MPEFMRKLPQVTKEQVQAGWLKYMGDKPTKPGFIEWLTAELNKGSEMPTPTTLVRFREKRDEEQRLEFLASKTDVTFDMVAFNARYRTIV